MDGGGIGYYEKDRFLIKVFNVLTDNRVLPFFSGTLNKNKIKM